MKIDLFQKILNNKRLQIAPKRVLFIHNLGIGDTVLITSTIKAFKKIFPKTDVFVLGSKTTEAILQNNPNIKKLFIYTPFITEYFKLVKKLRTQKFGMIIDLHNTFFSFKKLFLPLLVNSPTTVGFKRSGYRGIPFALKTEWPSGTHELINYLSILKIFNKTPPIYKPQIYFSKEEKMWLKNFLKSLGIKNDDFVVGIHPSTNNPLKQWGFGKFAKIADFLVDQYKAKILLTGTKEEFAQTEEVKNRMRNQSINLGGKLSLRQFCILSTAYKLLVTIDTSSVHIATANNTPTVAIYGPTDTEVWRPWNKKNQKVVRSNLECSPCYTNFKYKRCLWNKPKCTEQITEKQVISAIKNLVHKK